MTLGAINGRTVQFMVDTGATMIAMGAADADRMGLRLDGPPLLHDERFGDEIISDGVAPGAIQVPPDGRPILLAADCQTVGGYPKIATVISADLPALGRLRPGGQVAFER